MTIRDDKHKQGRLVKRTYRFWEADVDWIREHYPDNHNAIIRRLVGNWVEAEKRQRNAAKES